MIPAFTLCFLKHHDKILMLQRNKDPNKGLWNGVGGKIEKNETPVEACLREVKEETGFQLYRAQFCGVLSWVGHECGDGGVYLFTAVAPAADFSNCSEGILKWHSMDWVFSSPDVVSNIHVFGPHVVNGAKPQHYHFNYKGRDILNHCINPLPDEYQI